MVCPHAGLVECEAIGVIPENKTKPQLHVYGQCIQRYRCGLDQHQGTNDAELTDAAFPQLLTACCAAEVSHVSPIAAMKLMVGVF